MSIEPSSKIEWSWGARSSCSPRRSPGPDGRPRRAAVSSFGITGTNAHLILEEAPRESASRRSDGGDGATGPPLSASHLLVLSAKSEPALRDRARRLKCHLEGSTGGEIADVACSLALDRPTFEHRAVAVGDGRDELLKLLAALAEGEEAKGAVRGLAQDRGRAAFVFPGQGSQWLGMGRELVERSEVFAARLRECEEALSPHVDFSLEEVLTGPDGAAQLDRLEVLHPGSVRDDGLLSAALEGLWRHAGRRRRALPRGRSSPRYVSGGLSLEDAARIVGAAHQMRSPSSPGRVAAWLR